jgi:succinate dehydrogenase flavin-adding protein (antitoxin of CptAB toxin-antitoxin module)
MLELDALLRAFVDGPYARLGAQDKERFESLLSLPDPDLAAYLLGREDPPDAELRRLVAEIRAVLHP